MTFNNLIQMIVKIREIALFTRATPSCVPLPACFRYLISQAGANAAITDHEGLSPADLMIKDRCHWSSKQPTKGWSHTKGWSQDVSAGEIKKKV